MLGPIISENDPPYMYFAPWVTLAHQSWKKSEAVWLSGQVLDLGLKGH